MDGWTTASLPQLNRAYTSWYSQEQHYICRPYSSRILKTHTSNLQNSVCRARTLSLKPPHHYNSNQLHFNFIYTMSVIIVIVHRHNSKARPLNEQHWQGEKLSFKRKKPCAGPGSLKQQPVDSQLGKGGGGTEGEEQTQPPLHSVFYA